MWIDALVSSTNLLVGARVTQQEGITSEVSSSILLVAAGVTGSMTTLGSAVTYPPTKSFPNNRHTLFTGKILITPTTTDPDIIYSTPG